MALLVVDLRTNVSRTQFRTVELHLINRRRPGRVRRMQDQFIDFVPTPGGDLTRGVRVSEIDDLDPGLYLLVIRLLNARGASVGFRQILVTLRGNLGVTVLIAR